MALIIKCRKCHKRLRQTETDCPSCGGTSLRYIIDYWPRGRRGGRKQITLPKTTSSVAEAIELEKAFVSARHRAPVAMQIDADSTVADLFPDYLTWYKLHRKAGTAVDVNHAWESSIKPLLGDYKVAQIDTPHFTLYQKMRSKDLVPRKKRTVSNRTVNKELHYFSGFLKWCRRERHITVPYIQYDKLPCSRPLPIVLSPDEVNRILKAAEAEPFYRTFFLCLYSLGFRFAEAQGLKLQDFDFENRSVRVIQKGGTQKILPINDQIVDAVKALAESRSCKQDDYLFAMKRTKKPVTDVRVPIARICQKAKITKKVNPHLFRHSIATHLMGADVNQRTIQRYLGHSQSSTTDFYTHVALGHLRDAQDILGKISTKNKGKSKMISTQRT